MQAERHLTTSSELTHSAVRELAWAVASPLLLRGKDLRVWPGQSWCSELGQAILPWLRQVDREPDELHRFLLSETDRRLGARFERLIEFWLHHSPDFELRYRRLQWNEGGRTRGEFDFIVDNRQTGQTEHWEVAAKFYLGVPPCGPGTGLEWIGPGKRDRLKRKIGHLVDHQLVLGASPLARAFLRARDIRLNRTRALVKGRLFYPLDTRDQTSAVAVLDPDHERGLWCTVSMARSLPVISWTPLPKSLWLDPGRLHMAQDNITAFRAFAARAQRAPVCVDFELSTGQRQRCMIVADDWLDDISRSA